MAGFDYFRKMGDQYLPRTPNAAIRGIEAEILPVEAFIYAGTSSKAIDEEPHDLDQIERVSARENLDIDTNLMLVSVFEKLVKQHDSEIALFAAEGINQIETYYNKKIEVLKEKLKKMKDEGAKVTLKIDLAYCYFDFSQLYGNASTMNKFYLKEAFANLRPCLEKRTVSQSVLILLINIFLGMKLFGQAMQLLNKFGQPGTLHTLLLEAEIEFYNKNYIRVFLIFSELADKKESLTEESKLLLSYWLNR